jgi:hypothetical protein
MDTRDKQIKSILPKIQSDNTSASVNETFQNETLRPILKFQNEIILQYFEQFIIENKIEFVLLKHHLKITQINNLFKTNIQFKQFYLGLIVALFSLNEFQFYTQNKKEINKRIISMLIERLCSQIENIK